MEKSLRMTYSKRLHVEALFAFFPLEAIWLRYVDDHIPEPYGSGMWMTLALAKGKKT